MTSIIYARDIHNSYFLLHNRTYSYSNFDFLIELYEQILTMLWIHIKNKNSDGIHFFLHLFLFWGVGWGIFMSIVLCTHSYWFEGLLSLGQSSPIALVISFIEDMYGNDFIFMQTSSHIRIIDESMRVQIFEYQLYAMWRHLF